MNVADSKGYRSRIGRSKPKGGERAVSKQHKNWKMLGSFFKGIYLGREVVGVFYSSDPQSPHNGALCASISLKDGGSAEVPGEEILVSKTV